MSTLLERYQSVRAFTERLCAPLAIEDFVVQSMPDASPVKWHLAHTSWFFETFVLSEQRPYRDEYRFLFNSYYQALGPRHARPLRGTLSRPTVSEIRAYRSAVDERMMATLARGVAHDRAAVVELGLHHEQQHQELILTDIKHAFGSNPLRPAYRSRTPRPVQPVDPLRWHAVEGGVRAMGHAGEGFAFDNETPRHRTFVEPFEIADRLVTCGEWRAFIEDRGYARPELWLSEGWDAVQANEWAAPLYWELRDGTWWTMTLGGMAPVADDEPVCHVSGFEADAYARWARARLPREHEWEVVAAEQPRDGNFVESEAWHPLPATTTKRAVRQMFGDVWEWTSSAYAPYPGYSPPAGALGEYNGKFMVNQLVLRGGSCATPANHIRATYRNFFPPSARWQFAGVRLARDRR